MLSRRSYGEPSETAADSIPAVARTPFEAGVDEPGDAVTASGNARPAARRSPWPDSSGSKPGSRLRKLTNVRISRLAVTSSITLSATSAATSSRRGQ